MAVDTQSAVNALWGEPLRYTRAGTGSTHTVCGGRHIVGEEEGRSSYGVYTIRRERFTLACDALPFEPGLRDTVAPAKKNPRVVTSVGGSPFLKFWVLDAQYPTLIDTLDQTATVYRPSNAPDGEGFRNPTLATLYASQACRLQPDTTEREWDTAGRVTTRKRYVCVFGSAVVLQAMDVVEVSSVKYEVTQQSEVESLGVLTFALVERIS